MFKSSATEEISAEMNVAGCEVMTSKIHKIKNSILNE
jgi:hypothetical protein